MAVGFGIEIRYQRQADDAVALSPAVSYEPKISKDLCVVLSGIITVYVAVHVLYVDNQSVYCREQGLDIFGWDVEGCFYINLPAVTAKFSEAIDKIGMQTWLSTAECDTSIGGEEIKPVDANFPV